MSDQAESNLLPSPNQPELLPVAAAGIFDATEAVGEFTGERLFKHRPDTYRAVVVLLGQGLGMLRIGRMLGVSVNTVMAVRDREGATIEHVKTHLARVAHAGATLASEGIAERLGELLSNPHYKLDVKELKDLAVVYGILVQNGQLLAGQPTARLEVNEVKQPEHDDWNAYIAQLPAAQVVNVETVPTHLEGEKSGQKDAPDEATNAPTAPGSQPGPDHQANADTE